MEAGVARCILLRRGVGEARVCGCRGILCPGHVVNHHWLGLGVGEDPNPQL